MFLHKVVIDFCAQNQTSDSKKAEHMWYFIGNYMIGQILTPVEHRNREWCVKLNSSFLAGAPACAGGKTQQ